MTQGRKAPVTGGRAARWTNWAGNQSCTPVRVERPTTAAEVATAVTRAAERGETVKAVGSGHSFTAIAATDGVMLDLTAMCGLAGIVWDEAGGGARVRVRAGTRLADLNQMLAAQGLALANLGDIDRQTISGALATGTHGTGAAFGSLSSFVTGAQVVLADGSVVECSAQQRPDLFEAIRVGLGALGVVTQIEIACVPAFLIRADERPARLDEVLARLEEWRTGTDHFEFFWFPGTNRALTKHNTRLAPGQDGPRLAPWRRRLDDDFLSNTVLEGLCRLTTRLPRATSAANEIAGRALSARTYVAPSHEVFVSPREVRFRETEWAVPVAAAPGLIADLRAWLGRRDPLVGFPIEVRFGAADDVWLSTSHGRETAYLAFHEYHRAAPSAFFADVEAMMRAHDGRPHWGKLHTQSSQDVLALYPRAADVRRVRDEVDPGRVFTNDYVRQVLGA